VHTQERLPRAAVPSQTRPWVRQSRRFYRPRSKDWVGENRPGERRRQQCQRASRYDSNCLSATCLPQANRPGENGVSEKAPREPESAVLRPNKVT
jgi:hypothetical protein